MTVISLPLWKAAIKHHLTERWVHLNTLKAPKHRFISRPFEVAAKFDFHCRQQQMDRVNCSPIILCCSGRVFIRNWCFKWLLTFRAFMLHSPGEAFYWLSALKHKHLRCKQSQVIQKSLDGTTQTGAGVLSWANTGGNIWTLSEQKTAFRVSGVHVGAEMCTRCSSSGLLNLTTCKVSYLKKQREAAQTAPCRRDQLFLHTATSCVPTEILTFWTQSVEKRLRHPNTIGSPRQ